jgi:hypothetical protein
MDLVRFFIPFAITSAPREGKRRIDARDLTWKVAALSLCGQQFPEPRTHSSELREFNSARPKRPQHTDFMQTHNPPDRQVNGGAAPASKWYSSSRNAGKIS